MKEHVQTRMKRQYAKLVASITITVSVFFCAGVIVAMLYVGPNITREDSLHPLVLPIYSFGDVVVMGILFGFVSAIISLAILLPVVKHDKNRCLALSKQYGAPHGRALFLSQSSVVHRGPEHSPEQVFDDVLSAVSSLGVRLRVVDREVGCIEGFTRPFYASRITLKIDKLENGSHEITAVSTPVSGFLILDFGRNFEVVNQFAQALAQ